MNIILDTHLLIWALNDDDRLSDTAVSYILDPENYIYYSIASIWEVSIKHQSHPDNVEFTADDFVKYCRSAGFIPLDIKEKHVLTLDTLKRKEDSPRHHDPFDRIMIAQAKSEKMAFLTHDSLMLDYNEKCVISV